MLLIDTGRAEEVWLDGIVTGETQDLLPLYSDYAGDGCPGKGDIRFAGPAITKVPANPR